MDIKKPIIDKEEIEIYERKETIYEALGTLLLIGIAVIVLSALFVTLRLI